MPAFETVVRVKLEGFTAEAAKREHIRIARAELGKFMSRQTARPGVMIETDGHPAASEESVRPYGVIVYRFTRMREIVAFALSEAKRVSPIRSGRYRDSWFPMVNGHEVAMDQIQAGAEVLITNDQPYSRKINVGAAGFERYIRPNTVEKVRQLVLKKYRNIVEANILFVHLEGGWILQNSQRRTRKGRAYGGYRKDALRGMPITYPSLLLTPKFQ